MSRRIRIGINGFGRIGRAVLRVAAARHAIFDVVAINELLPAPYIGNLLMYDSVHGRFGGSVLVEGGALYCDGERIDLVQELDPANIGWSRFAVDVVIEATGQILDRSLAFRHLAAGARRVIISAPCQDDTPTYVYGVNHHLYASEQIISNSSCTTNCLAAIAKVLHDRFGIQRGLTTTIHAATSTQKTVDGADTARWRMGRGILENIIPVPTESAKAVGLVIPELKNKLTGTSYRVPISNMSLVDLTVELCCSTSYEAVRQAMKEASSVGSLEGVLGYTDDEVVASDLRGHPCSAIFDANAGLMLDSTFTKIVAWYDNEFGYANRLLDMARVMTTRETA